MKNRGKISPRPFAVAFRQWPRGAISSASRHPPPEPAPVRRSPPEPPSWSPSCARTSSSCDDARSGPSGRSEAECPGPSGHFARRPVPRGAERQPTQPRNASCLFSLVSLATNLCCPAPCAGPQSLIIPPARGQALSRPQLPCEMIRSRTRRPRA